MANAKLFQSTLPREERHDRQIQTCASRNISIHASTRGATKCRGVNERVQHISIHASTRGATFTVALNSNPFQFQSTLPREERRVRRQRIRKRIRFQSTLPREERRVRRQRIRKRIRFQSTLPREERPYR